jgi:hypothetical protein
MATGSRLRVETNRRHPPDEAKAEEEEAAPVAAMMMRWLYPVRVGLAVKMNAVIGECERRKRRRHQHQPTLVDIVCEECGGCKVRVYRASERRR